MKRLNGLFAFSKSKDALDQLTPWVQKLDIPSNDAAIRVWVYHPRGASAEALARTLNAVIGLPDQTASTSAAEQGSAGTTETRTVSTTQTAAYNPEAMENVPRITADKDTNAVIINAPESMRVRIQGLLNEIDREPAQVAIEASILEVTLNNEFNLGVDWSGISDNGHWSGSAFSGEATNFPTLAPGITINYVNTNIQAAVRALSSRSKVRIVSAPKIATVENGTASLQIGDQVPIITQSSQSTSSDDARLINTVDYRDTGVMLKVTPRISSSNRISLVVTQEVSSVARTQTSGIDSPTIRQRKMESTLIIPENQVVALGGLISSSQSESDSGTPYLKDIPWVGNLFKGQARNGDRTELIVLIQARILRTPSDHGEMIANLSADLKDLMKYGSISAQP